MSIDHEKIKKLISLVEQNQLTELAIEEDGLNITVKADHHTPQVFVSQGPSVISIDESHIDIHEDYHEHDEVEQICDMNHIEIVSPMVGVFYRQPSPDSPPYVEVGDIIEVGQPIGMIEAMKVFSEVLSELAGKIIALPIENGKLVQQDDLLALIDVSPVE
ncbi:MAG: acetyl-CoA carboxylase biotin carboxyl carrier protein [Armatimonadota bacterium]